MSKNKETITPKIIHIMADGTVRDSVEGYAVPVNDQTKIVYMLLAKWMREACEEGR